MLRLFGFCIFSIFGYFILINIFSTAMHIVIIFAIISTLLLNPYISIYSFLFWMSIHVMCLNTVLQFILVSLFLSVLMQFQTFSEVPKILKSNNFSSMLEQILPSWHSYINKLRYLLLQFSIHPCITKLQKLKSENMYTSTTILWFTVPQEMCFYLKNVLLLDLWFLFSFSKDSPFGRLCISFFAYRIFFHFKD